MSNDRDDGRGDSHEVTEGPEAAEHGVGVGGTGTAQPWGERATDGDDVLPVTPASAGRGVFFSHRFVFGGHGDLVVADFHHTEHDSLVLDTGLGLRDVDDLMSHIDSLQWQGDDLHVSLGGHLSLTLVGVRAGGLSADDLHILS